MATQEDEYAELLARANAEFEELGYVTEQTNEALLDAKTGVKNFSQAVAGPATQAIKSLGGVVGKTASAMYRGEKGAKAFDGALDSASEAADSASKALFALGGPLGLVAGALAFLIGAAAKAVKVVNEQLDKEQEAFQNISKSGMAASDGMTGLFSDMQKMRVNVLDSAKYQQMLAENSKDLSLFGGTAYDGRKKLANVSDNMEDFRLSMNRLGMTEDDQREALMGYIKSETQFGRAQGKTAEELAEGAKKYIAEQDALTKLSGVDRKTREQARLDALKEQGYAATLQDLKNRGMGDQAKRLEEANDMIADKLPETAKGLRALMSGNLSNADGVKLFGTGLAEIQDLQDKVKKGEITKEEYSAKIAENIKNYSDRQGVQQAMYEQNDKIALSFSEQQEARRLAETGYFNNFKEAVKDTADALTKPDPLLDDMAKAQKANTDAMLNTQATIQQAAPAAAKGMLMFAEAALAASEALGGKGKPWYEKMLERSAESEMGSEADMYGGSVGGEYVAPTGITPKPSATKPVAPGTMTVSQTRSGTTPATPPPAAAPGTMAVSQTRSGTTPATPVPPPAVAPGTMAVSQTRSGTTPAAAPIVVIATSPGSVGNFPNQTQDLGSMVGNMSNQSRANAKTTKAAPDDIKREMNNFHQESNISVAPVGIQMPQTKAANGGVFPAKPGGQHVLLAEAGQDEAVIPMKDGAVQVSMRNPGLMDNMAKPDIDATALGEMSESITMSIKEDLRSMVMDIVQQIQRPADNSGMSQAVLTQLDQLIAYQREANDIDTRILSVSS